MGLGTCVKDGERLWATVAQIRSIFGRDASLGLHESVLEAVIRGTSDDPVTALRQCNSFVAWLLRPTRRGNHCITDPETATGQG